MIIQIVYELINYTQRRNTRGIKENFYGSVFIFQDIGNIYLEKLK